MKIVSEKSIDRGDSCNTASLEFSNHLGSHVDAPLHFVPKGRSVDDYSPEDWMFDHPLLVNIQVGDSELVTISHLEKVIQNDEIPETDLLLIRTGFSKYRVEDRYWQAGPGLSSEIADWLYQYFPMLSAVGMDCISISSLQHREEGRKAHQSFLGNEIRIFEDLALDNIKKEETLIKVIALPMRFKEGDGAPCTLVGLLDKG